MLKKLFISLLILTTLTAEGAVNTIFDTLEKMSPGKMPGLYGYEGGFGMLPDMRGDTSGYLQNGIKTRIIPLEEILAKSSAKSRHSSDYQAADYSMQPAEMHLSTGKPLSLKLEAGALCSTDVSPPALSSFV